MTFYTPVSVAAVGMIYTALFVVAVSMVIMAAIRKLYGLMSGVIAVGIIAFAGLQCVLEICDIKREASKILLIRFFSVHILIYAVIFAAFIAAVEIFVGIKFYRWNKTHVTRQSISEALNGIAEGVCCYYPSGQILLLNHFMRENMLACCDKRSVRNGEWMYRNIFESQLTEGCRRLNIQGNTAIMMPDKRVLMMKADSVIIKGENLKLLFALDITEEYRKTEELYAERENLKDITKKLLDYNREIVGMTASAEVLNAKVKIHDSLGEELLVMRHYIETGGLEKEKQAIIDTLRKSLSFLLDENSSDKKDEYELMIETARDLGVDVIIDGELPQKKKIKRILSSGIHICFTNTIRHAKGDKLYVKVIENEDGITAEFKNNGMKPVGPIREKGGLKTLRELVEKTGGRFTIEHLPEFRLEILVPKEEM